MAERFGETNVFMDVDTIALGIDYTEAIERALASCDAVVTLIGRNWLAASDADGRRRLDDPGNILRLELERALARPLLIVPTSVQGAPLPREDELPRPLAPLARRQGIELRDEAWRDDGRRFCYFEGAEATLVWTDDEGRVGARANVWQGTGAAAAQTLLTQWSCCLEPQR